MYTFEIEYLDENGNMDVIRFCAESKEEAIQLFENWCNTDAKIDTKPDILDIKTVYDESDHLEYGENYQSLFTDITVDGVPYENINDALEAVTDKSNALRNRR